jgi:ribosomal protein L11 methyltransferase
MLLCLSINKGFSLENTWNFLESEGFEVLYGTEEEQGLFLYVKANSMEEIPAIDGLRDCSPYVVPPIDWEAQWEAHGLDFRDGMVHVSLEKYGKSGLPLTLKPGPGFGDLSHPTTHIVLDLMAHYLKDENVVDIGCGSGILSLAALAMGSPEVLGIDIDEEAIRHSQENAKLNHMEQKCHFLFPSEFQSAVSKLNIQKPLLIVMNMISSEQRVAWDSLPSLHGAKGKILVSGIRKEEKVSYLNLIKNWKWDLVEEREQEDWLGFCFSKK